MPPVLIDLRTTEDWRNVVHRCVQALVEGVLVAFPTETVYGVAASGLDEGAVAGLMETKGRRAGHALSLALKSADDRDYVPDMSRAGPAACPPLLARACHAGRRPRPPGEPAAAASAGVRRAWRPRGRWGCACPVTRSSWMSCECWVGPLVLTSDNRTGQPDAVTAREVIASLGDRIDLVVDDGPCRFRRAFVRGPRRRTTATRSSARA